MSDAAAPLADELEHLLAGGPAGARRDAIAALARGLLRRAPEEHLSPRPATELLGQVVRLYDWIDARREPVAVRVVDDGDGRAALELNAPDSPFLVDSVRAAVAAQGRTIRLLLHPVLGIERRPDGGIAAIGNARDAPARESVMRAEIAGRLTAAERDALQGEVAQALGDVRSAVDDHAAMQAFTARMVEVARAAGGRYGDEEIAETVAFLEWLRSGHLVLLGAREYALADGPEGPALTLVPGSGRGILRDESRSTYGEGLALARMADGLRERIEGGDLLLISKTNRVSRVHRRARMDSIDLKRIDASGAVVGELRLLGLFTSLVYLEQAASTPLLRRKLRRIVEAEDLIDGSHDHKATVAVFESFPRDELFAAGWAELRREVSAVLHADEQQRVSVVQRPDATGQGAAVLVAMPRDRFSPEVRHRLQELVRARFAGDSVDYHLSLGDAEAAQLFFSVHRRDGPLATVDPDALEAEVRAACRTWDDELLELAVRELGPDGSELAARYVRRFPRYHKSATAPGLALLQLRLLERARTGEAYAIGLQNEDPAHTQPGAEPLTRLIVAKLGGKMSLSSLLPLIESLGLTVVEEVPTRLVGEPDDGAYLHDLGVLADGAQVDLDRLAGPIEQAVRAILAGDAEADLLNGLVTRAAIAWQDVQLLRAYRRYRQMVRREFTETYQSQVLVDHADAAVLILGLFHARLGLAEPAPGDDELEYLAREIGERIDAVPSLDEDRILRGFLQLVLATVRTNAFRVPIAGGG